MVASNYRIVVLIAITIIIITITITIIIIIIIIINIIIVINIIITVIITIIIIIFSSSFGMVLPTTLLRMKAIPRMTVFYKHDVTIGMSIFFR